MLHAYLVRTGRIVRLLARAGIRVILDMHQDSFGSTFANRSAPIPWNAEGAPPWSTCTDGRPFVAPLEWQEALAAPPVAAAVHHLFVNDVRGDLEGQLARVWHAVAAYFRGDRNVLGYEVYNEPEDLLSADFTAELECDYGGPAHEPRSCARSRAPRRAPSPPAPGGRAHQAPSAPWSRSYPM